MLEDGFWYQLMKSYKRAIPGVVDSSHTDIHVWLYGRKTCFCHTMRPRLSVGVRLGGWLRLGMSVGVKFLVLLSHCVNQILGQPAPSISRQSASSPSRIAWATSLSNQPFRLLWGPQTVNSCPCVPGLRNLPFSSTKGDSIH